jgi:DNA-binding SARP family transcriptional activator
VEFRILGPLEVLDDGGASLAVGGGRERAVLALLLLSANRVVSSERLADDLWGDRPPEGTHALRVYVSRLRKALREAGGDGVLVTRPPGYVVRVEPGALDAARFEALLARGREEAAGGDHAGAAETLREALALWRGPALADVADAPCARAEAARLEEARLAALEERVEADLACGRHGTLVAELDALTRAHPLRERLWAQRMVALYRSGRQAEALRAYQELRGILGEELGLEPSAALARLEGAILRHDPELDWPPAPPSGPRVPVSAPAPAGVVTFLFTDLVGSTELLDRLGDDAADELRHVHFSLLRQAVSAAGGEEVKSLGDGLMVAFSSPLAALGCAVAMQQAVAGHNRTHPDRALGVRMGLHAGEPARDEGDFFGTAVVVAKRLCDRAEGGKILAGELVAALVGSRGGYRFVPLGPLPLKGLATPVPAVAVDWQAAEDGEPAVGPHEVGGAPPLPLPAFLTGMGRVFVGREAELEHLRVAWREAVSGGRRLVVVGGEPGVGKTRLAAALAEEVHGEGAIVLSGRCDEDLGVPYQPLVEALNQLVDHTPDPHLVPRLGRFGGELARLVPELAERAPGLVPPLRSDPETERYRLFDAVAAWLAATSRDAPALLVLDDLQWAARPTLLLVRHVVRSPAPMRLLALGTYRDTELGRDHPLGELLADLRRDDGVERLPLSGLDEAGVTAFMERATGHELDEEDLALAHAIYQETEGNPFFVREVLRHLTETGAFERREGRWVTRLPVEELGIPESVKDVVGRRLSRLSEAANDVLALAAVAGLEFRLAVLQASTSLDEEALLSSLDEAIAARLVIEVPSSCYRFAHALVRDTLYDELSAARRVLLHRRVAEAIETVHAGRLDDYLPALAHHFARASAAGADTTRAVAYATRAADLALARFANDEAVVYYSQAVDLLAMVEGRKESQLVQLRIALGEAQRRAGDPAYRQTLLDAAALAKNLHDVGGLARAALANTRSLIYSTTGEVDYERIAALEAALEMTPEAESATRARLLATLGLELVWDPGIARRVALSDEALSIARRVDDRAVLADVLLARYFTIGTPGNLDERLSNTTHLLAVAEHLGDKLMMSRALALAFRAAMETGNIEDATRCQQANEQLAAELRQPVLHHLAALENAGLALLAGRLDEAEHHIIAALERGQAAGQPDAFLYFVVPLAQVRCEQGRTVEVEGALLDHLARLPRVRTLESMLALHYAEQDRRADATRVFEGLAAGGFDIPLDLTWLRVMTDCAAVCAYLGDTTRALTLRGSLLPFSDQVVSIAYGSTVSGSVSYYLALLASVLGDLDEAETRFTAAEATHARIGAATWVARTRLEWARMLLARRESADVERARELLGQVLATARELSLANIERRAVALLQ